MTTKIQGFGQDAPEEEISEIEKTLGVLFQKGDKELCPPLVGKLCKIRHDNDTTFGYYRGVTEHGFVVVMPYVGRDFYPFSLFDLEKGRQNYFLEDGPKFIIAQSVREIEPVREEYIDHLIGESKKISNQKSDP